MVWLAALNFRPRVAPVQMRLECDITLVGDPSSSPTLSMYDKLMRVKPVSYTHLTLPTIYSV